MTRHLHERDHSRFTGDRLARAVRDHLDSKPVDLSAALAQYGADDGPASALPTGRFIINRYDHTLHRTVIVSAHDDKAEALAAFERCKGEEQAQRSSAQERGVAVPRSHHYQLVVRSE